jgi:hypothetical protein
MGARVIRQRRKSHRETRAMLVVVATVGLPVILAYALVAMDIRSDLSSLKAAVPPADQDTPVTGWADLQRFSGEGPVRMIGYMMDGDEPHGDGTAVRAFVLMPEAGQFLHPAHRIPDEMVAVRMREPVSFRYRELVWVTGRLSRTMGGDREQAAFAMSDATAEPASDREIMLWFRP